MAQRDALTVIVGQGRAVTVVGRPLPEVTALSITQAMAFFDALDARQPVPEPDDALLPRPHRK